MKTKWGGISGYVEQEEPVKHPLKEIEEENRLNHKNVTLLRIGSLLKH